MGSALATVAEDVAVNRNSELSVDVDVIDADPPLGRRDPFLENCLAR